MTGLRHLHSGKVRDLYEAGDGNLLVVASDRISAFDVVMDDPIPDKGRVLTAMTAFWLERLSDIAPHHLVTADPTDMPSEARDIPDLEGRTMLVRKADMVPIECVVRGYMSGSAWKEYRSQGTVHGAKLPEGLQNSSPFPEPMFTPSTKAEVGHDENISFEEAVRLVGEDVAEAAREISLAAYTRAAAWAMERGIVIADTKFELGYIDGELAICDEVLTPDSSRFWPAEAWQPGATPPSLDKQPVRDWLEESGWDKSPPPPKLPEDVIAATRRRYVSAYERLAGLRFDYWYGARR